ncbi:MAG: zinc dependent phospholipase C family protein [Gemmatimonadales bacterium]
MIRVLAALSVAAGCVALFPTDAFAWTPGTHVYLAETVLANLVQLPPAVADLLRAFPFDFLYGNIAADTSIAKRYAAVGRHSHFWNVGQEIHDRAESDAVRAFGLGYLAHLAADAVAHNHFVPRQLMLTSSTASFGHSYWETRVECHLGDAYARAARDVILLDHAHANAHLDRIISPTIFSVQTNRRLFRGMVRLTDTESWQRAAQAARARSRWDLADADVERHLALSYDYVVDVLADRSPAARELDPSGEAPLTTAKRRRREALRQAGRRDREQLRALAEESFGLPRADLFHWPRIARRLPWHAPEGAAPSPRLLAASDE